MVICPGLSVRKDISGSARGQIVWLIFRWPVRCQASSRWVRGGYRLRGKTGKTITGFDEYVQAHWQESWGTGAKS